MQDKISIIVPVFNTADYLETCIGSLIYQTYREIEILIIDDGSTDNSWEVLQRIAEGHDNIFLFRTENSGQGFARNLALEKTSGDYILFVDSDDWISLDMCEVLIRRLSSNDVDVLCFNYNLVYPDKFVTKDIIKDYGHWIGEECLEAFFNSKLTGHACNKLYKRSFLIFNKIRFLTDKRLYEDLPFSIKVLSYSKVIQYIADAPYYYRIRPSSSTQTFDLRMLDQLIMLDKSVEFMSDFGNYNRFKDGMSRMYSNGYVDILIRGFNADIKQINFSKRLKPWRIKVNLGFLNWKYRIIFIASLISHRLANWTYSVVISNIYPRLFILFKDKRSPRLPKSVC